MSGRTDGRREKAVVDGGAPVGEPRAVEEPLPIERLGVTLDAAPGFGLVVSYNPGYQSVLKDLKPSTRQRFVVGQE